MLPLLHGTIEPIMDAIEVEYQYMLALRCAAGLQFPPFMIVVTSPIISHALDVSGPSQLIKASDHWSEGITNVTASHLGLPSFTGLTTHGNFS